VPIFKHRKSQTLPRERSEPKVREADLCLTAQHSCQRAGTKRFKGDFQKPSRRKSYACSMQGLEGFLLRAWIRFKSVFLD
jgi:hypothetical protein